MMYCNVCGRETEDWEFFVRNQMVLCPYCFYARLDEAYLGYSCQNCGKKLSSGEVNYFNGKLLCENCARVDREYFRLTKCSICGKHIEGGKFFIDKKQVCEDCCKSKKGKEKGFFTSGTENIKESQKKETEKGLKTRMEKIIDRVFMSDDL